MNQRRLLFTVITHNKDVRFFRQAPKGARVIATCGTTRIITPTGPALKDEIQSLPPQRTPTPLVPVSSSASFLLFPGQRMMYSIYLDDGSDTDADWEQLDQDFPVIHTPPEAREASSTEVEHGTRKDYESDDSDEEYGETVQSAPKRKKGGYDSRIEQILYENPELPILIVDAGKSIESGGKYIVYTIRTGVYLPASTIKQRLTSG